MKKFKHKTLGWVAKQQEERTQKLKEQYLQEQAKSIEYRGDYIKSK